MGLGPGAATGRAGLPWGQAEAVGVLLPAPPVSQTAASCFCAAGELRVAFTSFVVENAFMAREKSMKFKCQRPQFYGNTAPPFLYAWSMRAAVTRPYGRKAYSACSVASQTRVGVGRGRLGGGTGRPEFWKAAWLQVHVRPQPQLAVTHSKSRDKWT